MPALPPSNRTKLDVSRVVLLTDTVLPVREYAATRLRVAEKPVELELTDSQLEPFITVLSE